MNAPIRILTADQVTSGAVLEHALRSAHGTEVLLSDFIGSIDSAARNAVLTDAQRTEARTIAQHLAAHAETLRALASSVGA